MEYYRPHQYPPYQRRPAVQVNYGKVATAVIGVCVAVFVLQAVAPEFMVKYFALRGASVWKYPWTLVSHVFLHGGVYHLFINMFGVFLFGYMLERNVGSRMFALVFFGAGVLGGIGQLMFSSPLVYGLGASGGLFGILGMMAVLRPKMIVYVNFIPVPMWLAVIGWGAFSAMMAGAETGIGHGAHLFGLLFGVGLGLWYRFGRRSPRGVEQGRQKFRTGQVPRQMQGLQGFRL